MAFDLKTIEALAPDQSSLSAASKLTKKGNWARLEKNDAQKLFWGECQGSGANPYRTVADASDQGYKCTCPSRKFPCKHSLALMWIEATAPDNFVEADTPDWVNDWLGRRRKGSGGAGAAASQGGSSKSIDEAQVGAQAEAAKPEDPAAAEKREAAQRKRAGETRKAIADGMDELDGWVSDQLRLGLSSFLDAATERCRRIAARLVDMKASGLASRIDEIPSRLIALRAEERPEAAIRELGKLVLLAKAWRAFPDNPDLRRAVSSTETREQVMSQADALAVASTWEVLGEKIETRRDGLVSHATWLLDVKAEAPRFALLQDFYPASAGKRSAAFTAGDCFEARLVFYPSPAPLRALVAERMGDVKAPESWPQLEAARVDPLACHMARQNIAPWEADSPVLLPPGTIVSDAREGAWWRADGEATIALPIAGAVPEAVLGVSLPAMAALWNGSRLSPLSALSEIGRLELS